MATLDLCTLEPSSLVAADLCLDELSKNAEGELRLLDAEVHECRKLDCRSLTADHLLELSLSSYRCDSDLGRLFDGKLISKDLTTVFARGTGLGRGLHTATFTWKSSAGLVQGHLSGMTNEGTHREPAFQGCQECDQQGVMEGRLCGRVVRPAKPELRGAQVTAAYRFAFEASEKAEGGRVVGTLEGLVVRSCGAERHCEAFQTVGDEPNPRTLGDLSVETRDFTGGTPATSSILTWGGITGLNLGHSATLGFAQPVSLVEVTLAQFAQAATATAYDVGGTAVATATMTAGRATPETLVLASSGIRSVVVVSPSNEVLMLQACWVLQS